METQDPPPCLCVHTGTTVVNLGTEAATLPPGHPSTCPICPLAFLLPNPLYFPQGTKKRKRNGKQNLSQQFVPLTVGHVLTLVVVLYPFHPMEFFFSLEIPERKIRHTRKPVLLCILLPLASGFSDILGKKPMSISSVFFQEGREGGRKEGRLAGVDGG